MVNKNIVDFKMLTKSDQDAIHDVLFDNDMIDLDDDEGVEPFYDKLPMDIQLDGLKWGFSDTEVREKMYEFFTQNK